MSWNLNLSLLSGLMIESSFDTNLGFSAKPREIKFSVSYAVVKKPFMC